MNATTSLHPIVSVDDYLAMEAASSIRHEYVAGQLFALGGASVRHNRIVRNLVRLLSDAADRTPDAPCEVLFAEVMVRVAPQLFYYPDVIITCEPDDNHPHYRTQPCVIFEVLSPGTQTTDRREKLFAHLQIAALRAYVLVSQDQRRVERYYRDEEGNWSTSSVFRHGDVPVPCLNAVLNLEQMYAGIDVTGSETEETSGDQSSANPIRS